MVTYEQYIERFRNWQLEKDERLLEVPMTEKEYENWIKPTVETDFSRAEKLTYKEMYLRLRKLLPEDKQKELDETCKPVLEKLDLV